MTSWSGSPPIWTLWTFASRSPKSEEKGESLLPGKRSAWWIISTYHFVTHWSNWRHPHTYMCAVAMCVGAKSRLWIKEIHWIALTLIFSLLCHLFLWFPFALGFNSLLNVATVQKFIPFTIIAYMHSAIPEMFYLLYVRRKTLLPFIILCDINYSDPPVLILALILVNIRTLKKNNCLLEKTINSCRLQPLHVYLWYEIETRNMLVVWLYGWQCATVSWSLWSRLNYWVD